MAIESDEEPFGTTPLPTSTADVDGDGTGAPVEIVMHMDPLVDIAQQPQTQQIAVYEPTPNEDCINGCLLDVNPHFVVYAVKNGLIRILHRHSAMRALLRGHAGQKVTDIRFFLDGDVLGTIGSKGPGDSTLIIWRVFEQSPEIQSEMLLEISSTSMQAPELTMSRLLWHPFNPNQFWMMHSTQASKQVATLVETTRIQTRLSEDVGDGSSQHAVCQWHSPYSVMDGALQLQDASGGLTDLAWSGRDARHVLTVHDSGTIILWDLKQKDVVNDDESAGQDVTIPRKLCVLREDDATPYSRCCFLPHEQSVGQESTLSTSLTTCFVTASHQNTVVTLWSAFKVPPSNAATANAPLQYLAPTKLQTIHMVPHPLTSQPTSFVMDVCYGPAPPNAAPPSCFLLMASRQTGRLFALHVRSVWSNDTVQQTQPQQQRALCVGVDYLVPFQLKHAIYSWSVVCSPTQDIAEEEIGERAGLIFDMKCFSYQSKSVQCLTLTSYMCLPPEHAYKNGKYQGIVKVGPLTGKYAIAGSAENCDIVPTAVTSLDADYDEDYDVEDEDELEDARAESEAPPPIGGLFPSTGGPLAQNPFANWLGAIAGANAAAQNPPPPPNPSDMEDAVTETFLSPVEMLAGGSADTAVATGQPTRTTTPSKQQRSSQKKAKGRSRSPKRSKSPKGKKNEDKNPFPDGKVTILKREPNAATTLPSEPVAPPLPPDPRLIANPAILAAAGIPLAPPLPTHNASVDMAAIESQISKAVAETMTSAMVPAVNMAIQESFAALARPLRTSMDNLSKQGVSVNQDELKNALNIEAPLKAAMADTMRNVLVPTLESVVSQVLKQVETSMPAPPLDQSKAMEALMQQLAMMNAKMDGLTKEVHVLRNAVAGQGASASRGPTPPQSGPPPPGGPSPSPSPQQILEQTRNTVTMLLQQGQFEAAFTKAVSASTPEMTVYCCSRTDISQIFGGSTPKLSQPILLCLMQQLGAVLSKTSNAQDLQTALSWLQEISLSLNPSDPSIQRHVPSVLQQLVQCINTRIVAEGNSGNTQLRRPLQMLLQVLRGMQMG
jgi:enhancer of mRNA-decapping protein 4